MSRFLEDLRKRNLPQWSITYVAGAWLGMQVIDVVAEPWGLALGVIRLLQTLILFGFPVTLVVAWYHGEEGRQRVTGVELLLLALLLGIGGGVLSVVADGDQSGVAEDVAVPEPPGLPGEDLVRLCVLPPRVSGAPEEWGPLIQGLLTGELSRARGAAVMDHLSLNTTLEAGADATAGDVPPPFERLRNFGMEFAVRTVAEPDPSGRGTLLQHAVLDTRDGRVVFTFTNAVPDDEALPPALREAADAIVQFIEESRGGITQAADLAPWLATEQAPVAAQRAFLQGVSYAYDFQPGGEEHFRRALDIAPGFIAPRIWLVSSLVARGDTAEALAQARRLEALRDRATPFERVMISWAQATAAGDREAKVRHLRVALARSPRNNILILNLAATLGALGRWDETVDALQPALDGGWQHPELLPLLGRAQIERRDVEGLRARLLRGTEVPVRHPYLHGVLSALFLYEGDAGSSASQLDEFRSRTAGADRDARSLAPVFSRLADMAFLDGRRETAAALVSRALTLDERDTEALALLALLRAADGNREGALVAYGTLADRDGDRSDASYWAGRAAQALGHEDEAVDHFRRYLSRDALGVHADDARARLGTLRDSSGVAIPPPQEVQS